MYYTISNCLSMIWKFASQMKQNHSSSFFFHKLIALFYFSPGGKKASITSFVCFWENKGIMLLTLQGKQKYQVTNVGVEN